MKGTQWNNTNQTKLSVKEREGKITRVRCRVITKIKNITLEGSIHFWVLCCIGLGVVLYWCFTFKPLPRVVWRTDDNACIANRCEDMASAPSQMQACPPFSALLCKMSTNGFKRWDPVSPPLWNCANYPWYTVENHTEFSFPAQNHTNKFLFDLFSSSQTQQ